MIENLEFDKIKIRKSQKQIEVVFPRFVLYETMVDALIVLSDAGEIEKNTPISVYYILNGQEMLLHNPSINFPLYLFKK